MTEIPKIYEPEKVEAKWYQFWLEKNYFHALDTSEKKPFSIVIPPPNVTGELHIGHALDNTLQDILIRWRRMQGYNTLWMPGTDHAGIVTQLVVEDKLREEGSSRQELGREKFLARMWDWVGESRGTMIEQLRRLGSSCDWERERFTLDEGLSRAVNEAFVRLYKDGLIYRGKYIVNWCPNCRTAVSDLEVEHEEESGNLYYIKYHLKESDEHLVIATTRPETMLGDTAVAVHPNDERYQNCVGKTVILPILERELPIIADDYVDMEFGTGALKVTPAHDANDFDIGNRHNLAQVIAMNEDGTMSAETGKFEGLDRFDCRRALLAELQEKGYLLKSEDYMVPMGRHDRCDTIIEPCVSLQWFVKTKPLAEKAIAAAKSGRVKFTPEREERRFYDWMHNIRDWCISRQIWWGHQIPIWYCQACDGISVGKPEKCDKCGAEELEQESDVLDTWFSSALWPFSTMGWPKETDLLKTFYPTSVLVTGWDILFFWVARMVMMGLWMCDDVPFYDVYLHGLVADETGAKMSKSRGNAIDPLPMMDKYGTDAFRFAIASSTIPNPYMPLPEERIKGCRNFANKLWNVSRLLLMNLEGFSPDESKQLKLTLGDRWIRSRFNTAAQEVTNHLETFNFNEASQRIYDFLWHEYCDWYAELIKMRFNLPDESREKYTAQYVASEVLDGILRLLHPFMPFITEEIWQRLAENGRLSEPPSSRRSDMLTSFGSPPLAKGGRGDLHKTVNYKRVENLPENSESIAVAPWREFDPNLSDPDAEDAMALIMNVINGIRNIRGEMNVPPVCEVTVYIGVPEEKDRACLTENVSYINFLAKAAEVHIAEHQDKPKMSAVAVVGEVEIYLPLAGLIDIEKEKSRLSRKLAKVSKDLVGIEKALSNQNFLQKAKPEVVQQRKDKRVELEAEKAKLEKNVAMLAE